MLGINIVTSVFSLADRTLEKAFVDSGKLDLGLVSADSNVVQSLNSLFFPPHIGAEPGGGGRGDQKRVQNNLHAHAENEPIKNY